MRYVPDCPNAALLPSRRHHALARLIAVAHAAFASKRSQSAERVMLTLREGQSATEAYVASIVMVTVWSAVLLLPLRGVPLWLFLPAAILSPIAATLALQLPTYVCGGAIWPRFRQLPERRHVVLNEAVLFAITALLAIALTRAGSAFRWIGWAFLAALALNIVAALLLFPLRGVVERVERRVLEQCGG